MSHENRSKTKPRLRISATDFGLLTVLFLAPLFMGGRHPLGRLVFVALVYTTAILWLLDSARHNKTELTFHRTFWIPVAGLAIVIFQLLPLDASWLSIFSPRVKTLLPQWSDQAHLGLGTWNTISLAPGETRISFAVFSAYVLLFLVVVNRIKSADDVRRWIGRLAFSTMFFGLVGLLQYLVPNGRFLWVYAHPTRDTFDAANGSFTNANHFSHLLALGIGPLMWLSFGGSKTSSHKKDSSHFQICAISGLCVSLVASSLSFSRGGILVTLFATVVSGLLMIPRRGLDRNWLKAACILSVCGLAILIHGYKKMGTQIGSLASDFDGAISNRLALWTVVADAVPDFLRMGSGAGTHREVYPTYLQAKPDVEYTHAENGYLQVIQETGVPGFLLLLAGITIVFRWLIQSFRSMDARQRTALAAVGIGFVVSMLHALIDFVWYIPACMSLTIFLIAIIFVSWQQSCNQRAAISVPRVGWIASVFLVVLSGLSTVNWLIGPARASFAWDNYFTYSLAAGGKIRPSSRSGRLRHTDRSSADTSSAISQMRHHLEQVVKNDPFNARAHDRLASVYLQEFDLLQSRSENPMGISQIRDAAYASRFQTKAELYRWLQAALEDNLKLLDAAMHHAQQSVRLCPLHGASYLYLSELLFLQNPNPDLTEKMIAQANLVRPMDGSVLLACGKKYADAGNFDMAFDSWKQAFHLNNEFRNKLISMMTPHLPVKEFVRRFEPEVGDLKYLFAYYRDQGDQDAARFVAKSIANVISDSFKEVKTYSQVVEAGELLFSVGRFADAANYLGRAVDFSPFDFNVRWKLGLSFYRMANYEMAMPHLEWCDRRRPNQQAIEKTLRAARKGLKRHTVVNDPPR